MLGFYRRSLRAEILQELFDVLGFCSCLTCWVSGAVWCAGFQELFDVLGFRSCFT